LEASKEITALLHLIDDPDEEVYDAVSNKIISFGKVIIPNLESLWETTLSESIQLRIESIIHKLHFRDLTNEFIDWKKNECDLLTGAILTAKYHYPEVDAGVINQEIEKIRRNIWIELNQYLTPLEEANIFNSILFNYYKHKGVEINYTQPEYFLLNKTLEAHKGNAVGNGIMYLILAELLDLPVRAIQIPRQFILAYVDEQYHLRHPYASEAEKIKFFIDPINGQIYSHQDVENYLKRISLTPTNSYFKTLSNKNIIQFLVKELGNCFDNEANLYKKEELIGLSKIIEE